MASVTAAPAPVTAGSPSAASPGKRDYARIAELTWIWSIVGYTVLRFVIAWGAFAEHGANVWIFGLLDVGTAWPYAKSVAIVCKRAASSEWKTLPAPLVVAVGSFFAPYAYLWFAAGEMPAGVRIGMAICVSVLLVAATAGVLTKTRKLRRDAAEARADNTIDLRRDAAEARADNTIDLRRDAAEARADNTIDLRNPALAQEIVIDLTGAEASIARTTAS